MSAKWRKRTHGTNAQIGQTVKIEKKEPFRLPARSGMEPTERVAGVHERNLSQPDGAITVEYKNGRYWARVSGYGSQYLGYGATEKEAIADAQEAVANIKRGGQPQTAEYWAQKKGAATAYWCPDCGKEFSGADGQTKCPHCQSLNLERSLGNKRWIKADADEIGAAHLIHTRAAGPRADQPCKIDKGLCMTHGYSVSPTVPCPVGGGKPSEATWALEKDFLEGRISKEKYEKERLKREASDLRNKYTSKYAKGEISEKAWRAKCNEADKMAAPSKDDVLNTLESRSLAQGRPTEENQRYNGWSNWDTWETKLILDNTQETQKWEEAWGKNWHQKIKAGKFDPEKAELVVSKYLVPVARGKRKWAGADVAADPEIDPKKVNKAEIVHNIISDYEQEEKYRESQVKPVSAETRYRVTNSLYGTSKVISASSSDAAKRKALEDVKTSAYSHKQLMKHLSATIEKGET